jgi:hypothetical protein
VVEPRSLSEGGQAEQHAGGQEGKAGAHRLSAWCWNGSLLAGTTDDTRPQPLETPSIRRKAKLSTNRLP